MSLGQRPQCASRTSAPARPTEVAAEKAITATASRAWWRTRRGDACVTGVMLMAVSTLAGWWSGVVRGGLACEEGNRSSGQAPPAGRWEGRSPSGTGEGDPEGWRQRAETSPDDRCGVVLVGAGLPGQSP